MVGIVLLNYNNWDMTIECIKSIRETTKIPYMIYIVDNGSNVRMTGGFETFIKSLDNCMLIENKINKGFSAGNNVGLYKALEDKCEYILVSNNDVVFQRDSVKALVDFLSQNDEYGIVGPKVFKPNGELQEINMGCKMTISGKYKIIFQKIPFRFCQTKFVKAFHAIEKSKDESFDVYAVSGCCFMMTNEVANNLYPLDENVFLYEEENIIGTKMEQLKKKTAYVVESSIIHLGGETTRRMSKFSYACFIKSEQYYCKEYLNAIWIQRRPLFWIRVIKGIKEYGLGILQEIKNMS